MLSFAPFPGDKIAVPCPHCQRPMVRGTARPILFTSGLSDVPYTCEGCGTDTVRTVRGDGTPHLAGSEGNR